MHRELNTDSSESFGKDIYFERNIETNQLFVATGEGSAALQLDIRSFVNKLGKGHFR